MDTLENVRRDVSRFVGDSGTCPDDPRVVEAINDARRVLYPLGDWKDTTEPLCLVPFNGTITLPPEFDYAKKGYHCNGGIQVENDWFSRIADWTHYCGSPCGPLVKQPGEYITFRDWPTKRQTCHSCPPAGFRVKVVFESDHDIGTEITFHAIGVNRRNISLTRVCEKAWEANLGGPNDEWVHELRYVVKPETHGRIRVYGMDGKNPELLLAVYDPKHVNPQMTRYSVPGLRRRGNVALKAKKKFIKVTDDKMPVDIHTDALIHALQAITERANRNVAGYAANLKMATDFLNRELAGPESTTTSPIQMSSAYRVEGLI